MQLSDKAKESLESVRKAFEDGNLEPVVQAARIRLSPDAPLAKWSLSNIFLALTQSGKVADCRGFNQWKEAGRSVKKGARAVFIFGPRFAAKDKDAEDAQSKLIGFTTIPVFPRFATEPLDGSPDTPDPLASAEPPPLMEVAARFGLDVTYAPMVASLGHYCAGGGDKRIVLGTESPAVFFHELAHAAHDRIESLRNVDEQQRETVAEFTAAILCHMYGIPHTGNAYQYIGVYNDDPLTAIHKALATVQKVLDEIFAVPA